MEFSSHGTNQSMVVLLESFCWLHVRNLTPLMSTDAIRWSRTHDLINESLSYRSSMMNHMYLMLCNFKPSHASCHIQQSVNHSPSFQFECTLKSHLVSPRLSGNRPRWFHWVICSTFSIEVDPCSLGLDIN